MRNKEFNTFFDYWADSTETIVPIFVAVLLVFTL